ncbi:MAG: DEAD/DEAH box helicase [Nitrospirota bacterium]
MVNHGAEARLIEIIRKMGLKELYPPQELAVKAGLLKKGESFVIAAPTASGKTLIAEMASLKVFFGIGKKIVYLVPLRALASEKYEDFLDKYSGIGMRIMQSTGDYDSSEPWLHEADLIITTNEKMDSLIRHRSSWLRDIELIVADEIHMIGDRHRGPTLEIVLTRLRSMYPQLRIVALSATIPNAEEISRWLGARLICSDWRPVPLREGVFFNSAAIFNEGTVKWISEVSKVAAIDIALKTIKDKGQALIFVNTRKSTEAVARMAGKYLSDLLSEEEKRILAGLSGEVLAASPEPTRVCKKLAECVSNGVAFHHAGIIYQQRKLIEDAFRAYRLKLIAATTTLAMGLNLPSRSVIIRDWWRYESGIGMIPIPAIEIKQMSGRAGRPGFDKYGEAVLVARNRRDERYLFEHYIKGEPEGIDSQIDDESALRTHILASISGDFARNRIELLDFLGMTFFAFQRGNRRLTSLVEEIIGFLEDEGMIVAEKDGLHPTRFGRRVSELYIDPLTGVVLRNALTEKREKDVFSLLHMIAHTPDMMALRVRKADYEEMLDVFYAHAGNLLIPDEEKLPTDEVLSEIKTASALMQWILEMPEDKIVGHFGIGPGDVRTIIELSDWLLYSASEIAKIFRLKDEVKKISLLRVRVKYGIKEELLELVSLRGIGRIRARNLFNSGFKSLGDIKKASIGELSNVPAVGKIIAEDIKRQVSPLQGDIANHTTSV